MRMTGEEIDALIEATAEQLERFTLADRGKQRGKRATVIDDSGGEFLPMDEDGDELDDEDTDEGLDDENMDDPDSGDTYDDDELDDESELDDEDDFKSPIVRRDGPSVGPDGRSNGRDYPDGTTPGGSKAERFRRWQSNPKAKAAKPASQEHKLAEATRAIALSEYGKPVSRLTHAEFAEVQLLAAQRTGYRGDDGGATYTLAEGDHSGDSDELQTTIERMAYREHGMPSSKLTHVQLAQLQQRAAKMSGY